MGWITGRAVFAGDLWRQEKFGPVPTLAAVLLAILQHYRDQWANTDTAEAMRLVAIFPSATWLIVLGLAALAVWIFEAAFQRQRPLLSVFFGDPRWGVEWTPANDGKPIGPVIQLLIMTVRNGQSAKIDECQVQVRVRNAVTPGLETITHSICRPFSLRPDEQEQVRLLSYQFDKAGSELSIKRYSRGENGGWFVIPDMTLSATTQHITVEVLSAQSKVARMHLTAKYTDRWHFFQGGTELLA